MQSEHHQEPPVQHDRNPLRVPVGNVDDVHWAIGAHPAKLGEQRGGVVPQMGRHIQLTGRRLPANGNAVDPYTFLKVYSLVVRAVGEDPRKVTFGGKARSERVDGASNAVDLPRRVLLREQAYVQLVRPPA